MTCRSIVWTELSRVRLKRSTERAIVRYATPPRTRSGTIPTRSIWVVSLDRMDALRLVIAVSSLFVTCRGGSEGREEPCGIEQGYRAAATVHDPEDGGGVRRRGVVGGGDLAEGFQGHHVVDGDGHLQ